MGFKVSLTPEDMRSGELVDRAAWCPIQVTDYTEKEAGENAKNPGSTNCIFEFTILDGLNKGLVINKLINENPRSLGHKSNQSLWAGFGFPKNAQGTYDLSSDLFKQTIGHKLMGYVKRTDDGKYNEISDFKPLS